MRIECMVPLIAVLWFQYQNTATSGTKPLILSVTFSLQVPKNASKIKANLEFHQSSDDFIASASPRANCPFLPFCPNKRRSWWEWTIWWSFALALFLVLLLWGGVDDGKGEWDVNWYIWRKLYTNEGVKSFRHNCHYCHYCQACVFGGKNWWYWNSSI